MICKKDSTKFFVFLLISFIGVFPFRINGAGLSNKILNKEAWREAFDLDAFSAYNEFLAPEIINNQNTYNRFDVADLFSMNLEGGSFRWNGYYEDGFRLNDPFFPGTPLHYPSLDVKQVSYDVFRHGVFFSNRFNKSSLSNVLSSGEHFPRFSSGGRLNLPLNFLQDGFFGVPVHKTTGIDSPDHPIERNPAMTNNRKRNLYQFKGHYYKLSVLREGVLESYGVFYSGIRYFNAFTRTGAIRKKFPEQSLRLKGEFNLFFTNRLRYFSDSIHGRISTLFRDQLYAEYYYGTNETARLYKTAASFWFKRNRGRRNLNAGLSAVTRTIVHHDLEFTRNFADHDGRGLEPWSPDITTFELIPQFSYTRDHQIPFFNRFAYSLKSRGNFVFFKPEREVWTNAVYFDDETGTTQKALYAAVYQSTPSYYSLGSAVSSVSFKKKLLKNFFHFSFDGGVKWQYLTVGGSDQKSLSFVFPFFKFKSVWVKGRYGLAAAETGLHPLPLTSDMAKFLSASYLSGVRYYWEDDGNLQLDDNEISSEIYQTTGGAYHDISEGLKQPWMWYMNYPFELKAGRHINMKLSMFLKKFFDLFYVRYGESHENYETKATAEGAFETEDGRVWVYTNAQARYVIDNASSVVIHSPHHEPFKNSMYITAAVFDFKASYKRFSWYLTFQGLAAVGLMPPANGSDSLAWETLTEMTASANSFENYPGGRPFFDRGYNGYTGVHCQINQIFSTGLLVRWYDGEPYAQYSSYVYTKNGHNQAVIQRESSSGGLVIVEDLYYSDHEGPRVSAGWNSVLMFRARVPLKNRSVDINLKFHNLLDMAYPLAVSAFKDGRYPIEMHNPPGIELKAEVKW